ncbi:HpcH/HpaI aldolase/citrate lyase family protein [Bordetella bronchiseptica MBORD678]|nr:HpcH/HpaI aldolase/citrate lyase family protein [Bordetella bronchiseptica 00-P-2796]KCV55025.1 HpcH/HpaI aldolase/citrate lyase family protein [Bordetella bronchiseptica 980]KDB83972.1 HpcH/HpaI aldolase/citrate lyase family protein [Bordetella bronchiseptica CARE970018BB]KDC03617.1 HpcH/HpaI aldolase/citrate lyase family protein [Bordetella bronchiseptica E010]KDC08330.1 HpcH/HpaI aldolase/citrate lyase family protein [Bordetella bronchiseptica E012]KDC37923.1 HpcH/HpaI aldolase/citrate l
MDMTTQVKPIRSFLFVPGNKESMLDKAALAKADALILDLEDSVPPAEKLAARELVARKIPALIAQGQRIWVRINRSAHIYDLDDILAVAQPGVEGVVISKPWGPEDVYMASSMIAEAETRANLPLGSIGLIPLLETARSMQLCYEIAQMPRVVGIVGATAKNADMGRALKFVWTPEGRETEYLKSRVVMAARAAGKQAIGGIWQQIKDLEGLARSSAFDRQLGMSGELALHPMQVETINRTYTPTAEDVAYYQGMIDALDAAQAQGRASVMYDGEHIDIAHVKTAHEVIALARAFDA